MHPEGSYKCVTLSGPIYARRSFKCVILSRAAKRRSRRTFCPVFLLSAAQKFLVRATRICFSFSNSSLAPAVFPCARNTVPSD